MTKKLIVLIKFKFKYRKIFKNILHYSSLPTTTTSSIFGLLLRLLWLWYLLIFLFLLIQKHLRLLLQFIDLQQFNFLISSGHIGWYLCKLLIQIVLILFVLCLIPALEFIHDVGILIGYNIFQVIDLGIDLRCIFINPFLQLVRLLLDNLLRYQLRIFRYNHYRFLLNNPQEHLYILLCQQRAPYMTNYLLSNPNRLHDVNEIILKQPQSIERLLVLCLQDGCLLFFVQYSLFQGGLFLPFPGVEWSSSLF